MRNALAIIDVPLSARSVKAAPFYEISRRDPYAHHSKSLFQIGTSPSDSKGFTHKVVFKNPPAVSFRYDH